MSDTEAEGEWDQTKGKVREGLGKISGDREEQAHGKLDQSKGKAKKALGKTERKIKGED
ncbi:MAG: CsbD family protein [archaeon]|jgi:uncharacterized protein YjbJ (UPF0337 family)|nr:CsbD family protein [archaeon]